MKEWAWSQPICGVWPNKILLRGYRIEELIGRVPFAHVVYLVLRGELPGEAEGRLLDAVLVSCVDHGGGSPSVMAARTVASGGASLTTAMAAGVLAIQQHHGGAIEGCMRLLGEALAEKRRRQTDLRGIARELVQICRVSGRRLPGFGHQLHTQDPRTGRLLALCEEEGLAGEYIELMWELKEALRDALGRELPINADGAIAAVLCELGLPPEAGNAFFVFSRMVGLAAHALDEMTHQRPARPICPQAQVYDGPPERPLQEAP